MKVSNSNPILYAGFEGIAGGMVVSAIAVQPPVAGSNDDRELPLWTKVSGALKGQVRVPMDKALCEGKLNCKSLRLRAVVPAEWFGTVRVSFTRDIDPPVRPVVGEMVLSREPGCSSVTVFVDVAIEVEL